MSSIILAAALDEVELRPKEAALQGPDEGVDDGSFEAVAPRDGEDLKTETAVFRFLDEQALLALEQVASEGRVGDGGPFVVVDAISLFYGVYDPYSRDVSFRARRHDFVGASDEARRHGWVAAPVEDGTLGLGEVRVLEVNAHGAYVEACRRKLLGTGESAFADIGIRRRLFVAREEMMQPLGLRAAEPEFAPKRTWQRQEEKQP